MDRRAFIQKVGLGLVATGATLGGCGPACARESRQAVARKKAGGSPRVAVVHDDGVRRAQDLNGTRVGALLDRGLREAFGTRKASDGLRSVVSDGDTVGIKLNNLAGQPLSPTREIADSLVDQLRKVGVASDRIIFFERGERDIRKGGFDVRRTGGPRYVGHDTPGFGYEPEPTLSGDVGSCLSRIVTSKIDVLINLGVLKDHNLAGVSAGMKNLYGILHNPNKYHDDNCDPFVADVSAFPVVQKKLRLVILDGITAQCEGGPGYVPGHAWPFNGVLVSTDPVALDRVAWDLLESQRKRKGLPSLAEAGRPPRWLQTAANRGLGEGDLSKIRVARGG